MKLIFCPKCSDILKLRNYDRTCACGDSGGRYVNFLDAHIWGEAIPLGIHNDSLADALKKRPEEGGGVKFEAFVIPWKCKTIKDTKARSRNEES